MSITTTVAEGGRIALHSRRIRHHAVFTVVTALLLAAVFAGVGGGIAVTTTWAALLVFGAALSCEYIDSSLGMGYGTTLTPLLMIAGLEPLTIVPAILLSECLTGFTAAAMHHRHGNVDFLRHRGARRTAITLSSLSVVGAVAAAMIAVRIPKEWLSGGIAVIVIGVGVLVLATQRRRIVYRRGHIIGLGALAAFNKGLSGGGYGPLVTGGQVVLGVAPRHAIAITSLAEGLVCLVGFIAYAVVRGLPDWSLTVPLCLGALLSVPMATLTVRRLPESALRLGVGIVTSALGLLIVVRLFV